MTPTHHNTSQRSRIHQHRQSRPRHGFTIIEIIIVISLIGLLIAIMLPVLGNVRRNSMMVQCGSNLRQLATATLNYMASSNNALPQVAAPDPFTGEMNIVGALFGGKRGQLPMFGIDQWGAEHRPLNAFLGGPLNDEDVPLFHCPLDRGQPAQPPFVPAVESMYDFIGTSYTLNDHALDSERCATLIPDKTAGKPGGRMPHVSDPTRTWMIGPIPIYNYQEGGDRQQYWYANRRVVVNLAFVDGHVDLRLDVPPTTVGPDGFMQQNTTSDYTFLPREDWQHRHCGFLLEGD